MRCVLTKAAKTGGTGMRTQRLLSGAFALLAGAAASAADTARIEILVGSASWEALGPARCVWLPEGPRSVEVLLDHRGTPEAQSLLVLDRQHAFDLRADASGGYLATSMESTGENTPRRLRLPAVGAEASAELEFKRAGDVCVVRLTLPPDLRRLSEAAETESTSARLRAVADVALRMTDSTRLLRAKNDAKGALAPGLEAHEMAEATLGKAHPLTATTAVNLGSVYWNLGEYRQARQMAETASETFEQIYGPDAALTLDARKNAALYRWELGDLVGARAEFEQVRPLILSRFGERSNSALAVTNNLAVLYQELGLVHEALELLSFSYLAREVRDGPDDRRTLIALNNLSTALRSVGRDDDARQLSELSFERHRAALGAADPDTLRAQHNLATMRCGETTLDCPMLQEVARVKAEVLGADHPETLQSRGYLGSLLLKQGRPAEALPELEAVYQARLQKMSATHWWTILALAIAAQARALSIDPEGGLQQLRQAVTSMEAVLGPANAMTLDMVGILAQVCGSLGQADCRRQALQTVVERAEGERGLVLLRGPQQATFTRRWVPWYRALAQLQASDGNRAAAVRTIERSKARGLVATLGVKRAELIGGLPSEITDKLTAQERELAALDVERNRTTNAARITQIDMQQSAVARDLAAQRAELRAQFPKYAAASEVDVPEARVMARSIAADEIFLGYAALDDGFLVYTAEATGRLEVQFVRMPHAASAVEAWRTVLAKTEGTRVWSQADGAFLAGAVPPAMWAQQSTPTELATYLTSALLGTARGRVAGYTRWIISPDGPLATLPFETLQWQGARVAERIDVRYVQSLAVYRLLRQRAAAGSGSLFAMGGPTFGTETDKAPSASNQVADKLALRGRADDVATLLTRSVNDPQSTRRAFATMGVDWPPLPSAEREAKAVAALFPGAVVFTGDDATEDRLQQMDARGELTRFRYLLFSTHGYLSTEAPALSAVVLRQPGSAQADGYVTAAEWAGYTLRSELIVLSACETGLGKDVAGEGVIGLPYAMFIAGNRNTLLSLWKVPHVSTAEFMIRFFGKLRAGTPQVSALAQTKRELMNSARFKDPIHWAGFVLYGS